MHKMLLGEIQENQRTPWPSVSATPEIMKWNLPLHLVWSERQNLALYEIRDEQLHLSGWKN